MAVLPIRLFPDPILRKPTRRVAPNEPIEEFLEDLIETLCAQPSGIGIAAPQVGERLRILVVDVSPRDPKKKREILINPVLVSREGEAMSREGCMSLPDYTANVMRFAKVTVRWRDEKGKIKTRGFSGIEAICLQHEMDHLEGGLIIDRVGCLKTDVIPRRHRI